MSITSDIRSYADTAIEQGKQVLDSTVANAQAQLNDVTGQANEFVGNAKDNVSGLTSKITGSATETVTDLRAQAEKAVNLDALRSAVEPYLAQAKGYTTTVTDRAEELYAAVRNDPRVATLVSTAESLTGVVVETVQERVIKPVQSLTGRGSKPVAKRAAPKPSAAKAAPKPASTKPASTKPASKTTARKAPARKSSSTSANGTSNA